MADSCVQLQSVHKAYNGKTVIENVSLNIGRGTAVALCGGNGAGKSTLIRMLAGIMLPTSGSITVDGVHWRSNRQAYADKIGYMPDDYKFSAGLTAMETMLFWARLRGLGKTRAAEVLSLVGLSDTGAKPVASFSKGMRQRVLFAQALLAKPLLLIMDEPTNGLDPYWMQTFVELVRMTVAEGSTVLFSTHQLPIAESLSDRILFLQGGSIVLDGGTEEIRKGYGAEGLQTAFGQLFGLAGMQG
ncbi:ABC transporter ATP-binding protein [Paenibacillus sp. strain BS8-2]